MPAAGDKPLIRQRSIPGAHSETVYDVAVPVMIEGSAQRWGTVRIGVSLEGMNKQITRTGWQIVAFGLLAVLLSSLSSVVLAERITKPLRALTQGVAAVGRGDFNQQIEVHSHDELGQLSAAFNEMSRQLSHVRELEDRLRRADRLAALGTMAAGIAHDIRNPLTSILIFSQLMSMHHDDPSVREKFDRVVPRELERVQAVIEEMMELARPMNVQLEPVNLNEILSQILELFETQATNQGIKIIREFDPDLPYGMVDRKRLHRCFSNLVSNAVQAMPNGGDLKLSTQSVPAMTFAVSRPAGTRPEPAVCVTISDTGQGIPPERLSRIFDPFYTTKEKGLGLGMAIAHRIVEDHKGTIDVRSEVGVGTAFTVHLPVAP